jgi:hypothetical protein
MIADDLSQTSTPSCPRRDWRFRARLGDSARERGDVARSRLIGYLPLMPRAHLREHRPLYWFRRGIEFVRHKFSGTTRQKRLHFLLGCGKPPSMAALCGALGGCVTPARALLRAQSQTDAGYGCMTIYSRLPAVVAASMAAGSSVSGNIRGRIGLMSSSLLRSKSSSRR